MASKQYFDHLAAFVRSLSHELRTPLSVISNDLQSLAVKSPSDECERGIRKCREISEQLSPLASLFATPLDLSPLVLDVLIRATVGKEWSYSKQHSPAVCFADRERLVAVLKHISATLVAAQRKEERTPITYSILESTAQLELHIDSSVEFNGAKDFQSLAGLTKLVAPITETAHTYILLLDTVLSAQCGRINGKAAGNVLSLSLLLPKSNDRDKPPYY